MEQLIYTPTELATSAENPHTMVLMVDKDSYVKYTADASSVAIAEVVGSFDVMQYENPGKAGRLIRPSKRELQECFGTSNQMEVAEFMLKNGKLHGKNKAISKNAKSNMQSH
jgi:ribosome maturation protein Sdo1